MLFLRGFFTIRTIILLLLCFTAGCQFRVSDYYFAGESDPAAVYDNMFTVPGQAIHHPDVYSLQLFRQGSALSAPVIRLSSNQQLVLRFDMMETGTRQFRAVITHHNPDWTPSSLPPEDFMESFSEAFFGGGTPSVSRQPPYRRYEYRLPNSELVFTASGNYMIHVEDFETRERLFSLPFFIYENEGEIRSSAERFTRTGQDLRDGITPNSTYHYPDFIDMPQFDLEYWFVQNQFWGRAQKADAWDTATPGSVFYELSRSQAFTEDTGIRSLNLPDITRMGTLIRDYRPDLVPPGVFLDVDVQGLNPRPGSPAGSRFGRPDPDPEARYGDLHFRFEPHSPIGRNAKIYLTGDFNNWSIREELMLRRNPETRFLEVSTFIKEGSYTYKYVLLEGGQILDLTPEEIFTTTRQELTTFVYYRDPGRHHYRLLQANTFYSD